MLMRTFTPLTLVVVSVVALSLLLPVKTARAADFGILVTIEGAKQGKFKGADKSGKISAMAFSREITSPRDAATGQASGRVQNLPVTVTKSVDAASPQLLQAMATNEVLKSVTIEFYGPTETGEQAITQAIRLTNATVAGLRQYMDGGDDGATDLGLREDVSLSFQTLEFVGEGSPALTQKPTTPLRPAEPVAPAVGAGPTVGTGSTPPLTRTPRPAPGGVIVSPNLTPVAPSSPKLAPVPDASAAAGPTPTATTAPTLTRAQRARRAAAAAAAATAPATAPTVEATPAPATKPAAEQPAPTPTPVPVPRKRR